jgi:hypothetical protein
VFFLVVSLIEAGGWIGTRIYTQHPFVFPSERGFLQELALAFSAMGDGFQNVPPVMMLCAAIFYGFYRVLDFHPDLRSEYRKWLTLTPWSSSQQLPLGPVHLVAQDALLIGLMVALTAPLYGWNSVWIVRVFSISYLLALMLAMGAAEEWLTTYAIAFALAIMVVWSAELQFWLLVSIAYAFGIVGIRRSLKRLESQFDWTEWVRSEFLKNDSSHAAADLSWPFGRISPSIQAKNLSLAHGTALSLLVGLWVLAILTAMNRMKPIDDPKDPFPGVLVALFPTVILVVVRLARYDLFRYAPPISLVGRVLTGRWIVPGYDQVLVAPLLALVLFAPLYSFLKRIGLEIRLAEAITVTAIGFILFNLGPRPRRWMLTGGHRILCGEFGQKPTNSV